MTVTKPSPRRFAKLVSEMELSPESTTVLTVLARHRTRNLADIQDLLDRLDGSARSVGLEVVGQGESDDPAVADLAKLLCDWSDSV